METMNQACAVEAARSISRLPHEILATIFILHARNYHYGHLGCPTHDAPCWVNVSYVCRQWRGVALNCPTLWSYVFIASRRWTEELLDRSKQASLKVRVRLLYLCGEPRWRNSVDEVLDHMERIQELRLELPLWCYDQLRPKLSFPAPRLQNLQILVDDISRESLLVCPNGDTPALRTLVLSNCPLPWHSFTLGGLTVLGLHYVPVSLRLKPEDFVAVLSCMQHLNRLYLDQALASAVDLLSSRAFHTVAKVNLPRLSRLLIVAPLSTVIVLLFCVDVPSETEVRLKCNSEGRSTLDDYNLLSSLLPQRFSLSGNQTLSSLAIRSLSLNFYERGISDLEWDHGIPLKIIFYRALVRVRHDWDRIASEVCCQMPLDGVESVHVAGPPFSRAFWRKTLAPLLRTRYLKLSHGNMPDLASELSLPDNGPSGPAVGDEDRSQPLAPQLEELELYQITFSSRKPRASELAIPYQDLVNALSTRRGLQGRLTITRCKLAGEYDAGDYVMGWGDGGVHEVPEVSSDEDEPAT